MAVNSKRRAIAGAFGERFVASCWRTAGFSHPAPSPAIAAAVSRGLHASIYDKNYDEHLRGGGAATTVPDDVIQAKPSDKYWGPHPETGIFGPPGQPSAAAAGNGSSSSASVLDVKAWFRPQDVDKPPPHA